MSTRGGRNAWPRRDNGRYSGRCRDFSRQPKNMVQRAVEVVKVKVVRHFMGPYSPLEKDGVKWVWGYAAAAVEMARIFV